MKYLYGAKVIEIYDGDTLTALIDLGFNITIEEKIRLYGINAPEMRGKEKPQGIISRDYLRKRILGKEVIIETIKDKKGKYGRYLGIIKFEGKNINEEMVKKKLAKINYYK